MCDSNLDQSGYSSEEICKMTNQHNCITGGNVKADGLVKFGSNNSMIEALGSILLYGTA